MLALLHGLLAHAFRGGARVREPEPDYSSQQYERPNQPWVCGLATRARVPGRADGGGGCPALAECAPVRDGDRWQCNRSALRGGACDEGPTPEGGCGCVLAAGRCEACGRSAGDLWRRARCLRPARLLIMLSANWRDAAISPGPLVAAARAADGARRDGGQLCGLSCGGRAKRGGWAAAMVVGHRRRRRNRSCAWSATTRRFRRELALAAHNVPADAAAQDYDGNRAGVRRMAAE